MTKTTKKPVAEMTQDEKRVRAAELMGWFRSQAISLDGDVLDWDTWYRPNGDPASKDNSDLPDPYAPLDDAMAFWEWYEIHHIGSWYMATSLGLGNGHRFMIMEIPCTEISGAEAVFLPAAITDAVLLAEEAKADA